MPSSSKTTLPGTKYTQAIPPEDMKAFRELFCRYGDSNANLEIIKAISSSQGGGGESLYFPPQIPGGTSPTEAPKEDTGSKWERKFTVALPYAGKAEYDWCKKGSGSGGFFGGWADSSQSETSYTLNRGYWSWIPYIFGYSSSSITQTLPLCQEISVWVNSAIEALREDVGSALEEGLLRNGAQLLEEDEAAGIKQENKNGVFDERRDACLLAIEDMTNTLIRGGRTGGTATFINPYVSCATAAKMVDARKKPADPAAAPAFPYTTPSFGAPEQGKNPDSLSPKEKVDWLFRRWFRGIAASDIKRNYDFCVPASSTERFWFVVLGQVTGIIVAVTTGVAAFVRFGISAIGYVAGYGLLMIPFGDKLGFKSIGHGILDWLKRRAETRKAAKEAKKVDKKGRGDGPGGPPAPAGGGGAPEVAVAPKDAAAPAPDARRSLLPEAHEVVSLETIVGGALLYPVASKLVGWAYRIPQLLGGVEAGFATFAPRLVPLTSAAAGVGIIPNLGGHINALGNAIDCGIREEASERCNAWRKRRRQEEMLNSIL